MESIEDRIKEFLNIDVGFGHYGSGYPFGCEIKEGTGYGKGTAVARGQILGIAENYIWQRVNMFEACVNVFLFEGRGTSCGYGKPNGCGHGGCVSAFGVTIPEIKEVNGQKVYVVDDTLTIISAVHGNVAKGFIVRKDLQLIPCYIVKDRSHFAHGETLREAFDSLREKMYDDSTEEERIEVFKKKFPNFDQEYNNRDFFVYHHVLTGSCKMGRENFVKERGLSLDGQTTVREFVNLTKNAYGGEIIRKLPMAYHVVIE